ncbi:MAG: response regulator [Deltaproteobacteria bacterium]|nr:response regulator [Deltaproteobacteria bacterium]
MRAALKQEKENSRVIIAEDNAKTRLFLKNQLELLGYQVIGAVSNGQAAVDLVSELRPALVIMDIKMPKLDGIDAARRITETGPIPIILITGMSSDEMATKAIEAGVFAYLVKPVTKKQLEPAIKLALARYEQFKSLKTEVSDLKDAIETRKLVERAKGILMKRCNIPEDEAFKLLQAHSQKENKKMREIAENIISAAKLI